MDHRDGAIRVRDIILEADGKWTGIRVDIGEGGRFHRQFDIMASPAGMKFEIHPREEVWGAIVVVTPDGSKTRINAYDGRWFVASYDPSGKYLGAIDLVKEETDG